MKRIPHYQPSLDRNVLKGTSGHKNRYFIRIY